MTKLEIKRQWITPDITRALSDNCYQIAQGDFHKTNLLGLLKGEGGVDLAAAARTIVDLFWQSPIPAFYENQFNDKCALWLNFSTLRYHQTGRSETHVHWHYDYNFFKSDVCALVAWVPFDRVGEDAPGLEFCLPIREIPAENFARMFVGGKPPATFNDALIDDLFGPGNQERVVPMLGPGDVVLFDQFVMHRTQPLVEASANRLAIEFRMTSATTPSKRLQAEPFMGLSYRQADGTVIATSAAKLFGQG